MKHLAALAFIFIAATGSVAGAEGGRKMETATFAGGCFWCMEPPFQNTPGVINVISGYTGGRTANPTYEEVSIGSTGHIEAVQVTFDPQKVSYTDLVEVFWRNMDPTDAGGQFADRGSQYHPAIFYHSDEQKKLAEESKARLAASGKFNKPIVVEIRKAAPFYPAEEYHQDYHSKNPLRYKMYKAGSGREDFLKRTWDIEKVPDPGRKK